MWGTWWEWGDPRLTSELVLLFLYLGYMALRNAIDDIAKADRASAVLALVGAVNIPIIHFSVEWWSSLLLRRLRTEVLYRERRKRWVRDMVLSGTGKSK